MNSHILEYQEAPGRAQCAAAAPLSNPSAFTHINNLGHA